MKKYYFILILATVAILGCKTTTNVVQETPTQTPKEESNLQKWNPEIQQKLEALKVDPLKISFFNSSEINLNQNLVKQIVEVIEGEVFLTDSIFNIEKTIAEEELGALKEKRAPGSPVTVSFSERDKSYQMTFIYSKEENAFVLTNSAIFSFRGIDYKVTPKIKERCYLLFSLKKEKIVTEINEKAEGISPQ